MAHICPICNEWCKCNLDTDDEESDFDTEDCVHYLKCVPESMEHIGNEQETEDKDL